MAVMETVGAINAATLFNDRYRLGNVYGITSRNDNVGFLFHARSLAKKRYFIICYTVIQAPMQLKMNLYS